MRMIYDCNNKYFNIITIKLNILVSELTRQLNLNFMREIYSSEIIIKLHLILYQKILVIMENQNKLIVRNINFYYL